ncbi:ArsR/SmtB family transcription factor [Paenibacillus gansuensis]|uniref:ArsR/SmtB family transcription factor n=1 Tax=Paenibacillus gansuensis TaxID=306542 RepID=A0ABW5PC30_9BACL
MQIEVSTKHMAILECFSSETRVRIIELLRDRPHNIKELAEALQLSSAIVTKHIQKLEDAGIITSHSSAGVRGTQKVCSLHLDSLTLQFRQPVLPAEDSAKYSVEVPIGQYADYAVKPTCGLVSGTKALGLYDDPRYFSDPGRVQAAHLWFGSGFVEYRIPNYLHAGQSVRAVEFSLELCSEAPGYNENWPSDISFYLNDTLTGVWTCPGDFGSRRGVFTPAWWDIGTQHGLLKKLSVREDGTYLDGVKLTDVSIRDLSIVHGEDFRFRIASHEDARNCGGVSLFGKQFGNYNQDIVVTVYYDDLK